LPYLGLRAITHFEQAGFSDSAEALCGPLSADWTLQKEEQPDRL
jgi:hypothetical protein